MINIQSNALPALVNYIATSCTSFINIRTSFSTGDNDDVAITGEDIYPHFFLEQPFTSAYVTPNMLTWNLALIITDIELHEKTNELDKQALCFDLGNILMQKFKNDKIYSFFDAGVNFLSLNEFSDDNTAGFRIEFQLSQPIPVCAINSDTIFYSSSTYSQYYSTPFVPYPNKIYRALVSQDGTADPTVIILENTLGPVIWTRVTDGQYFGTLTGQLIRTKTWVNTTSNDSVDDDSCFGLSTYDNDSVLLTSGSRLGETTADGFLVYQPIIIIVNP